MNAVIDNSSSPFHEGEHRVQTRAGVREKTEEIGRRFIRDYMPDQHRDFYEALPFVILATLDDTGQPWTSLVTGEKGFITSPDPETLILEATLLSGDPLAGNLKVGADVGLLGIGLEERRRNRMTGTISAIDDHRIVITVTQAFGNCPMYISKRELLFGNQPDASESDIERGSDLSTADRELIENADTFFIASHYTAGQGATSDGADASHRGGRPGFVKVDDDGTITFPDYTGNNHFNTLGNIELNPKTGLLFFDFETGDMLYVAGEAEIIWDGEELDGFEGALRLVKFRTTDRIRANKSLPLRWSLEQASPFSEPTGTWSEVEAQKRAEAARNEYRSFVVKHIEQESDTIKSFYFEPNDDAGLACFQPGQFLPIKLDIPGQDKPVTRTYTLSDAPGRDYYRLSIKREPATSAEYAPGLVSNYFHDHLAVGSTIEAMAPRGHFVLDTDGDRPVVLLSAGVGITPMISMLNCLARRFLTCGKKRDVWFVHGTRNSSEQAFGQHLKVISDAMPHKNMHISYSEPLSKDELGETHDSVGWVDIGLLKKILPFNDYEFYLCGPPAFMKALYDGLKQLNVGDERIHYEFFGPATVIAPHKRPGSDQAAPIGDPVKVTFAKSGIEADWDAGKGTLLEFAEEQGIDAAYSCRSGACSTCSVKVLDGDVEYSNPPVVDVDEGSALICSAVPAEGNDDGVVLDL